MEVSNKQYIKNVWRKKNLKKKNTIKELATNLHKYGIRGFFRKWREGIKQIPPEDLLKTRLIGYIGAIIGLILSAVIMFYRGSWYIGIAIVFFCLIQVASFLGEYQQYMSMQQFQKAEINVKELLGGEK